MQFRGAVVCDAGTDVNGDDYCEIAAAGSHCVAACQAFQRACLGAFVASAEEPCVQGEPAGCLAEQPHLRCRCFN